jgi:hypothetical protein
MHACCAVREQQRPALPQFKVALLLCWCAQKRCCHQFRDCQLACSTAYACSNDQQQSQPYATLRTAPTTATVTLCVSFSACACHPSPHCPAPLLHPAGVARALLAIETDQGNCWTIGASPFCAGTCADCTNNGAECVSGNHQEGAACWTGYKVRCCKKPAGRR